MLQPDREIHNQDDQDQLDPTGQGNKVEEAPTPSAGIGGRQNGGEWKKHRKGAQGERVDHNKDPIGDPAPVFVRPRTARGQMFNAG